MTSLKPPGTLFGNARATAVTVVRKGAFTNVYIILIPIGMPLLVLVAGSAGTLACKLAKQAAALDPTATYGQNHQPEMPHAHHSRRYSRGYLPHIDGEGLVQFVTFRHRTKS